MRNIQTLIKMQKLQVDQQRRILAEKQRVVDEILSQIAMLNAGLEVEKMQAMQEGGNATQFGIFLQKELKRKKQLLQRLKTAEKHALNEHEILSGLFEELKRYEIAQESWDAEEAKKAQRREQGDYDEQASQRHQRDKGG